MNKEDILKHIFNNISDNHVYQKRFFILSFKILKQS